MTLDDLRLLAIVAAAISICWWIIRDPRNQYRRSTLEQEREKLIEENAFAPQSRAELRAE